MERMANGRCILKKSKEKPLLRRHPWIFSGAIDQVDDQLKPGDLTDVYSSSGQFLGVGYFNPHSQITVRMLDFEPIDIDREFFKKRIESALRLRASYLKPDTTAYRVIHAEGDFLPGLVADRYGDYLVTQCQTAGMERHKEVVMQLLRDALPVKGIYEKNDSEWRAIEGLDQKEGVYWGEVPEEPVTITENGLKFRVSIQHGQKTGFYLDQRDNRKLLLDFVQDKMILNAFSYTGAFTVYALQGKARRVISADSSAPALELARRNCELNGFAPSEADFIQEDLFEYLRKSKDRFDGIILDPPAFCKNNRQIEKASRGYKDINLSAIKKINSGGFLFTFSCSSYLSPDLFQKIVFAAAADAKRDVRILLRTGQPADHPINIYHPEGAYLKGLLCQIA